MAELTPDEITKLVEAFNKLKVKPKADTPEDLELWLTEFGKRKESQIKVETKEESSSEVKTKTTFTTVHPPRISLFYGDDDKKGEATYAQWVYEVKCLLLEKVHKPEVIAQSIRNSVRGEASNKLRRLGYSATIPEILDKFESCYGNIDSKEHLLAKFYSSKQEEHEDVTKWSSRLEDILASAVERKLVPVDQVNDMLRNMFFQGLKPSLKDICAYKFEQIKDFDSLRVAIRKIEQDHLKSESQTTHCHSSINQKQSKKEEKSEMIEMKTMIQSLTNTVQQLENKFNSSQIFQGTDQGFNQNRGRGKQKFHYRGYSNVPNQGYNVNQRPVYQHQNYNQGRSQRPRSQGRGQYNQMSNQGQGQRLNNQYQGPRFNNPNYASQNQSQRSQSTNYQGQTQTADDNYEDVFNRGPLCFRCRDYGHYQWECGVRMDHSRKHLN